MKEILLTQGQVAKVSDEDYEELSKYKWYAARDHHAHNFYAGRGCCIDGKWKNVKMHRVVMGAQVGEIVDHRNHDTLDNQRGNLRICTDAENKRNQRPRRGSSIYKGICWCGDHSKWRSVVVFNKRHYHLGHFVDEVEAAWAYDIKARELFGEFALTNFPEVK